MCRVCPVVVVGSTQMVVCCGVFCCWLQTFVKALSLVCGCGMGGVVVWLLHVGMKVPRSLWWVAGRCVVGVVIVRFLVLLLWLVVCVLSCSL